MSHVKKNAAGDVFLFQKIEQQKKSNFHPSKNAMQIWTKEIRINFFEL